MDFSRVKKLHLPEDGYVVFGSGPLAVRGLREANDIDVLTTKASWEMLAEKYPVSQHHPDLISAEGVDVYRTWQSFDEAEIQEIIKNREIIDAVPFARLEYVLTWKAWRGLDKDMRDIELINNYLKKN